MRRSSPPPPGALRVRGSSVLTIECCDRHTFVANTNGVWSEYVITDDSYAQLGPSIQDIVPHVDGEDFGTYFSYKLVVQRSFRGSNWTDATSGDLMSPTTTTGYKTASAFTNRQEIGLRTRVVLRTQLSQAGDPTSGTLSVTLAVRVFVT